MARSIDIWKTAAYRRWWEEDWSWEGLRDKSKRPHLYFAPSPSFGTLQDVWRSEESQLIDFAGRRWTRFHLPPVDLVGNVCPSELILKAKDPAAWIPIEERLQSAAQLIDSRLEAPPEVDSGYTRDFVSLNGVVFAEDFWPLRKDFLSHIVADFGSAIFLGRFDWSARISASFQRTLFCDTLHVRGATFVGYSNFNEASFAGECWFSDANFWSSAWFEHADFSNPNTAFFSNIQFRRGASFNDAVFSGGCYFSYSNFVSTAFFDRVMFASADFSHATFASPYPAVFRRSRFSGYARFEDARFGGEAEFTHTIFEDIADFRDALFSAELKFSDARFAREASFAGGAPFTKEVDFENVTFSDDVTFSDRVFNTHTSFAQSTFRGVPEFYGAGLHPDTTFAGAHFRGDKKSHEIARPRREWFRNARTYDHRPRWRWQRRVRDERFHSEMIEAETSRTPRTLRKRRLKTYKYRLVLPFALRLPGMKRVRREHDLEVERCEIAYRRLRQLCREIGSIEYEGMFHALELRAHAERTNTSPTARIASIIYQWLSDCGRSIGTPLVWLAAAWAIFSITYLFAFMPPYRNAGAGVSAGVCSSMSARPSALEVLVAAGREFLPSLFGTANVANRPDWLRCAEGNGHFLFFLVSSVQIITFVLCIALFLIALRRRFQIHD